MKSIQENKHRRRLAIIILAIILAIAAAASVYVYAFNGNLLGWTNGQSSETNFAQDAPVAQSNPKTDDQSANIQDPEAQSNAQNTNKPAPREQPKVIQVTITSANQTSNSLQVRSLIDSMESQGVCTLTVERTGRQPVIQTSNVQVLHSSSTCQGFDVPLYQLTSGTWSITLDFKSTTTSGRATTTITIP